jgi:hypothetical protein
MLKWIKRVINQMGMLSRKKTRKTDRVGAFHKNHNEVIYFPYEMFLNKPNNNDISF